MLAQAQRGGIKLSTIGRSAFAGLTRSLAALV